MRVGDKREDLNRERRRKKKKIENVKKISLRNVIGRMKQIVIIKI